MKTPFLSIAMVLCLGCMPKGKYEAETAKTEGIYTRIDGMTRGMNQMGAEINRLKELQRANKLENEEAIRKIRIDNLQLSDVTDEIAQMNTAMDAYIAHHKKGELVRDNMLELKTKAAEALEHEQLSFSADGHHIGFVINTSVFAPANSPKLDEKGLPPIRALASILNDWELTLTEKQLASDSEARFDISSGEMVQGRERTRFLIVAHGDPGMPTGKRYDSVLELGMARAQSVLNILLEAGVKPARLATAVEVREAALEADASKEERAHARRIQIRVIRTLDGHPGFETLDAIESGKLRL
jgi:hypothetical protein